MKRVTKQCLEVLRRPRVLKFLLTFALLAALGNMVDWRRVAATGLQARPEWLLAAAGCLLLAYMVIAWRWLLIMRVSANAPDQARRYGPVFVMVAAGMGFGAILPTAVGADVARGVLLHTRSGSGGRAGAEFIVSSLLLDRYTSVLGTVLVGIAGSAVVGQWAVAVGLCLVLIAAAALTVALVMQLDRLLGLLMHGPFRRFRPKLDALAAELRAPGMLRRGLSPAILISVLLAIVRTAVFVCMYRGFDAPVPLGLALFAIPVLLIALMAPVTIGGFGLREWLLVVSFAEAGVPAAVSVSVGLVFFGLQIAVSLPAMFIAVLARPRAASATVKEDIR
ncbi:YbhN family protein [Leisingera sp. XS_AS12]|uniref:lysylphosphatidylglycerol synthase transmembrane domain-containing protein n=1 Tax=Leisingera sp. XS_AS12 TaxID=3241294 RepID=UPI0035121324